MWVKRADNPSYTDWFRFVLSPEGGVLSITTLGASFDAGDTNNVLPGIGTFQYWPGTWSSMPEHNEDSYTKISTTEFSINAAEADSYNGPDGTPPVFNRMIIDNFKRKSVGDSGTVEIEISGHTNESINAKYMRAY